ncbi:respiratory nitrate reductase subunit gamma [Stackebrandtia nassauensis]|uniref:Nitrate reductase-like protein NarX n=1 Tax=Stackebrandtia nassauensis (strain DSM 44728 / CIP 108903 / NRRL B-16338 / NBRC 102104 / LLR-40K-21) TaxID=446470 RepID=D3QBV6_STANL|nr:respiratory nitrate reductase subunit gamma [Stackebrandtia nassauensis]ADD44845.1 respiratory nitrate reductase, gamma subunit [Stackebrandtia nassauensis DSM 44728]
MTLLDHMLWGVAPYLVLLTLIGGTIWRHRYDRFGWTTRSSQLYESRLLRVASPIFHFGILLVIVGHVVGLLIPESWTRAVGVTDETYHLAALSLGALAGVATLGGIALLIWRRRTVGPVFSATTVNDKVMYLVLVAAIVAGLATTLLSTIDSIRDVPEVDYRQTVSVWFRSIWILNPDVAAMSAASMAFKIHVVIGMALFALFPFTRLVHAFSAPVGYPFRPYIVYRSRAAASRRNLRPIRRGW